MTLPDLVQPISPEILRQELHEGLLLRRTNKAGNEIYTFRAHEAPHVMQELGRLREEAFGYYGGGSGLPVDIDEYDTAPHGYRQLVVWNPEQQEIIGGYRYILGREVTFEGDQPYLASASIFNFSDQFIRDYLPYTIELGRSFVRLDYQRAKLSPKTIFALDNLWDGVGALSLYHEGYQYFFGKVTMYKAYNTRARDLILHYLRTYFPGSDTLVSPLYPITSTTPIDELEQVIVGDGRREDYRHLNEAVRKLGVNIPPLVNAYIGLSSALRYFGTAINSHFSEVEESAILIPFSEISEEKHTRHMKTFLRDAASQVPRTLLQRIKRRFL